MLVHSRDILFFGKYKPKKQRPGGGIPPSGQTKYFYDFAGRLAKFTENRGSHARRVEYTYTEENQVSQKSEFAGSVRQNTYYLYDGLHRRTHIGTNSTWWKYTYDTLGRVATQRFTVSGADILTETFAYNYYYEGSQLTSVSDGDVDIWIFYDTNRPVIIKYRDDGDEDTYHYELNLQGDVIAILDSDGIRVVEYTYDAWGNILSITGSKKDDLGLANPLRYRGYVYDHETGLYYLQSRYYDPQTRRFLNSDIVYDTDAGLQGYNLFIYCGNNPKNRIDASGFDSEDDDTAFDSTPEEEALLLGPGAKGGTGYGGGAAWDTFTSTLDSLASGFNMALGGGRNYNYTQKHHVIPYNNSKYSDGYRESLKPYAFSLTSKQNIIVLENHCGRHTEGYHKFIEGSIDAINIYANGDLGLFDIAFAYLKDFISNKPWLPYAR